MKRKWLKGAPQSQYMNADISVSIKTNISPNPSDQVRLAQNLLCINKK